MAKYQRKPVDYTKPLANMKQERFCQERIAGRNATQAATIAGYKQAKSQGSRMKGMKHVVGRIAHLQSLVQEASQITIAKVVSNILDTHRRAVLDGDEYAAENKSSDMLMRHLGGYEKDNEQSAIAVVSPITEAELRDKLAVIEQAGNGLDVGSIK